jgi:hypothetical protein
VLVRLHQITNMQAYETHLGKTGFAAALFRDYPDCMVGGNAGEVWYHSNSSSWRDILLVR